MRIPLNMGDNSKIEWTEATWNPVTGCSKVSAGCKNCYAQERGSSPGEKKDCGWAACLIGWSMDAMRDDRNTNDVRRLLKEIVEAKPRSARDGDAGTNGAGYRSAVRRLER